MAWFKRENTPLQPPGEEERRVRTEGLFSKCEDCKNVIWNRELENNLFVCPKCDFHFKIDAATRLSYLLDEGYREFDADLTSNDPLNFTDSRSYRLRLDEAIRRTGRNEAVITVEGSLKERPLMCAVMEYGFIGGSMGSVVGEKITRTVEKSLEKRLPLLIVSSSGGARMMEGVLSLMQMAKVSGALARLNKQGIPYISLLTDPTTGGVTASFAMLGDLNIAEPRALIGFAGPRVIEQTIRQKLPDEFQTSEYLVEHGMLDAVLHRSEHRDFIDDWLRFMMD